MKTKISVVKECENPEILILTPLLPTHKLSNITKKTIKRNNVSFYWITCSNNQNIPKNHMDGIKWYKQNYGKLPPYIQFVDRDIEVGRGLLDRLHKKLDKSPKNVGYCYATFKFKGYINHDFPAIPFDINRLLQSNYISSNSLFRSYIIENIGLVTDDKYKRLLDWAFLLKCFRNGYIGVPEPNAWFIAHSTEKDVSAGSQDDYRLKYTRVYNDFIIPIIKDYKKLDN
jgi:hypothetical protein